MARSLPRSPYIVYDQMLLWFALLGHILVLDGYQQRQHRKRTVQRDVSCKKRIEQCLEDKENEASKLFLTGIFGGISIGITIVVILMLVYLIWSRRKRGNGAKPKEPEDQDPRSYRDVGRTSGNRKTPFLVDSRENVSGAMRRRRVTQKKMGYRFKEKIKRNSRWLVRKTVPKWFLDRRQKVDEKLKNRPKQDEGMRYSRNRYPSTSTVGEITTYLDLDAGEDSYNLTSRDNQAETSTRSHTNRIFEFEHRGSISTLMQADSTKRVSDKSLNVADKDKKARPDTRIERQGNTRETAPQRTDELDKTGYWEVSGRTGHGKKAERRCSCSPNVDYAFASDKGRIFTVHAQVLANARPISRARSQTIGETSKARHQDNMECIVESWDKFATSSPVARKRRADTEPNKKRISNLSVNQKRAIYNSEAAFKQKKDLASVLRDREPTQKLSLGNVSQIKRSIDDTVLHYGSYDDQRFAAANQNCDSEIVAPLQKKSQSTVEGFVKSNASEQPSSRGTTATVSNQMESGRRLNHNSVRAVQRVPSTPDRHYNSFPRAAKRRRKVANLFSNISLDNSHHTELSDSLPPVWTRQRSGTERLESLCQNLEKLSMGIGASSLGIDTVS